MRKIILTMILLSLAGCAGKHLKRCSDTVDDESIWSCKDVIEGLYRACEPPKDLYRCEDPK